MWWVADRAILLGTARVFHSPSLGVYPATVFAEFRAGGDATILMPCVYSIDPHYHVSKLSRHFEAVASCVEVEVEVVMCLLMHVPAWPSYQSHHGSCDRQVSSISD